MKIGSFSVSVTVEKVSAAIHRNYCPNSIFQRLARVTVNVADESITAKGESTPFSSQHTVQTKMKYVFTAICGQGYNGQNSQMKLSEAKVTETLPRLMIVCITRTERDISHFQACAFSLYILIALVN